MKRLSLKATTVLVMLCLMPSCCRSFMIFGIVLSFFMRPNVPFSNDAAQLPSESERKQGDALSGA
jgi:hypothetical protein